MTDTSASPPGALRMTMADGYPGPSLIAGLPGTHDVRCSFQARWDGAADQDITIFLLGTPNDDDRVTLGLRTSGSIFLAEYSATPSIGTAVDIRGSLKKGAFVPVSVEIRGGAHPTYHVEVNGVVDQGDLEIPDFPSGYTDVELTLGPNNQVTSGTWSFAFDDLVCDAL